MAWADGATLPRYEVKVRRLDEDLAPLGDEITLGGGQLEGEAAGFLLSLGWHDPNNERAAKVKKCKVTLDKLSGKINVRESAIRRIRQLFKEQEDHFTEEIAKAVGGLVAQIPGMDKVLAAMVKAAATKKPRKKGGGK